VIDKHNPIQVWGTGEDIRDVIYVDDFVDGLINVIQKCTDKHEVVNIGSNTSYSVNEILDVCMEVDNYDAPIEYISGKPSMIPIRKISSEKMKDKYGWEAKTSLSEGIEKTITWYREYYDTES